MLVNSYLCNNWISNLDHWYDPKAYKQKPNAKSLSLTCYESNDMLEIYFQYKVELCLIIKKYGRSINDLKSKIIVEQLAISTCQVNRWRGITIQYYYSHNIF